jgi:hypothetical protein
MSIDLRPKFSKVMNNLAAKVAKKMKPTTGGLPVALKKAVLVQVTGRSRRIITQQDATTEGSTQLNKLYRTGRSSTRSPSTGWPF